MVSWKHQAGPGFPVYPPGRTAHSREEEYLQGNWGGGQKQGTDAGGQTHQAPHRSSLCPARTKQLKCPCWMPEGLTAHTAQRDVSPPTVTSFIWAPLPSCTRGKPAPGNTASSCKQLHFAAFLRDICGALDLSYFVEEGANCYHDSFVLFINSAFLELGTKSVLSPLLYLYSRR